MTNEDKNKMELLMNDTEWIPTDKDKWEKVKKKKYNIINKGVKIKKIKYNITKTLINNMKLYNKLYEKTKYIPKTNGNIVRIYLIQDQYNSYIGYTTMSVMRMIKTNLQRWLRGINNIFMGFRNIYDIKVSLLEYVKGHDPSKRKELIERKKYYSDKYKKKNKNYSIDECYKKYKEILENVINEYKRKINEFTGYIYKAYNKKNNRYFIGKTTKRITKNSKKQLLSYISYKNIENGNIDDLEITVIEKNKYKTIIELDLRVDYYIEKNIKDKNMYNKGTSILNISDNCMKYSTLLLLRKKMFILLQKEMFNRKFKDKTDYEKVKGIIYSIKNKNNNKLFISYDSNRKLTDIINIMYNTLLTKKNKASKILTVLSNIPYYELQFKVIVKKTKEYSVDLKKETLKLINKKKTIEKGYNIDRKKLREIYMRKK